MQSSKLELCQVPERDERFPQVPVLIGWSIIVFVQPLSSVWLCDPMDCSTPGFPVLHCPQEFAQTYVHWWCCPTISFSVIIPFSSCCQSFPASGSFPMSWHFASGGQSIGASASVLPMKIQGWFPLILTGFISLQTEGLSRVFSSTTVWRYQFFGTQPSLWSSSHIHT